MPSPSQSIARHVATVGGASLISRVLGFIRDMAIAALFGAGIRADAFFVVFQFVNLARRMLAEGALNAALVPLYLRARDEGGERAAGEFAGRLIGTLAVSLAVIVVLFAIAMPALVLLLAPGFKLGGERMTIATELARLMLPYLALAGPVAVLMGVLNANNRFATAALAAAAFNAIMLAALAFVFLHGGGNSESAARIVAAGVVFAGLAQLSLVAVVTWWGPERVTPLAVSFGPSVRRFLALAVPGLIAGGLPQITVIAGVMVASASRGAVSWIYYANRLFELPLGIVGIAVGTVLVPAFTHAVRGGGKAELSNVQSRGLELAMGLALPAAFALAVLAQPIVRVLFERGAFEASDTQATAAALVAFSAGLPGHVLVKVFSPLFFAHEDTATPMRAALVGFAVAIAASLALMPWLGHVGVAIAISLSGWASAALLAVQIARRFGFALDTDVRRRLPRIVLAAGAMAAAVHAAAASLAPWLAGGAPAAVSALVLAAVIGAGLVIYLLLLRALAVTSPRELLRSLRSGG